MPVLCLRVCYFGICYSPSGVFRFCFLLLGPTLAYLGSFWQPVDYFRVPWVAMEVSFLCIGRCSRFLPRLDVYFRANGSQVRSLRRNSGLLSAGSPRIPAKHRMLRKWRKGHSSQAHFTLESRQGYEDKLPQSILNFSIANL